MYQSLAVLRGDDHARDAHVTCTGQAPIQRDPVFRKSADNQRKEKKEMCSAPILSRMMAIFPDLDASDPSAKPKRNTTDAPNKDGALVSRKPDYPIADNEPGRLRRLEEAGFAEFDKIPALDALCSEAQALFGTGTAAVTLLTKEVQILKARVGIDVDETPRDVAFCNYTILEDRVFVVLDTHADPRFSQSPMTIGEPFIRFYAGAPLIYLSEVRIGAFCIFDPEPRQSFTPGEEAELEDFSERAVHILVDQLGKVT